MSKRSTVYRNDQLEAYRRHLDGMPCIFCHAPAGPRTVGHEPFHILPICKSAECESERRAVGSTALQERARLRWLQFATHDSTRR